MLISKAGCDFDDKIEESKRDFVNRLEEYKSTENILRNRVLDL